MSDATMSSADRRSSQFAEQASGTVRPSDGIGRTGSSQTHEVTDGSSSQQIEQQSLREELDTIVDAFRSNAVTEPQAIARIFRLLKYNPDVRDEQKEQTISLYVDSIKSH